MNEQQAKRTVCKVSTLRECGLSATHWAPMITVTILFDISWALDRLQFQGRDESR